MKILSRIGGAFLLVVLVAAAVLGFQTPTGRQIWDNLWSAGATLLSWLQSLIHQLVGTSIDGNASLAIAIAAVTVIVVLFLRGKPVSLGAFTALVLAAGLGAVILYDPSLVG